jgi:hypothetical protein
MQYLSFSRRSRFKYRSSGSWLSVVYSGRIPTFRRTFFLQLPVGIALGYGLDDRGSRVRFPAEIGNFFLRHRVQNGSEAHPASYPMGNRGSYPGGKAARVWSWPLTTNYCRGQTSSWGGAWLSTGATLLFTFTSQGEVNDRGKGDMDMGRKYNSG